MYGQIVRQMRREKGWKQEDLAALCGITQSYISMIETGEMIPTLRILTKMASVFGLPLHELMRRAEVTQDTPEAVSAA